ncbi:MAG TPA: beta-eliminating lyase-related protein [Streptosporangiaceae bacterium]|nr:beta-eliminating lyase-related protein [Streptosporangiaceae bacterium]
MPAAPELSLAGQAALRARCSVFVAGHGQVTAADLLATIPAGTVTDRYGDDGVVFDLEAEIAGLLGKPAAVFVPSGTMAQQCVLRVHADRRQRKTVIFHPMCHLDRHEGGAYQRLPRPACPAAVLDELRFDGDQDTGLADLGVLRACKLVGSGGRYLRTGSVRLVDPQTFGTGRCAPPTPLKATVI